MTPLRSFLYRLRALFLRRRVEAELDEELRFHIERQTEEYIRDGLAPKEARRRARVAFGGVEQTKERSREAWGVRRLEDMGRDLRQAVRTLRDSPVFAGVVVLTLALGIGANTAVFSVVDGVLLRPLSYDEPDRIVRLFEYAADGTGRGTISAPNFHDWRERATVFEAAALYDEYTPTLTGGDVPIRVYGASVEASYFEVLGVEPAVGRFFAPEDDVPGSQRIVLSWGLWRERFGGDAGAMGSTIELNGLPYTVIGVAPRGFEDSGLSGASFGEPRLWRSTPSYFETNGRTSNSFTAIARLRPGVSIERAEDELSTIHARLVERYPEANPNTIVRLASLKDDIVGEVRPALIVLLAAVGLVLVIACANVANLMLFRAADRVREVSLRAALGASRGRLVQQMLVESLALAFAGAVVGAGLAFLATQALGELAAGHLPRAGNVAVDLRVLGFATAVTVATALLVGFVPALRATDVDLADALSAGGRTATGDRRQARFRGALVTAEVALAVIVVIGGGLLARSLVRLHAVDPGIQAEHVLALKIDPPVDPYFSDNADTLGTRVTDLYARLVERLHGVPGVEAAALIDVLPLSGSFNGRGYRVVGEPAPAPDEEQDAEVRATSPEYFETMGIPLVRGRGIRSADGAASDRVVVVNRALVRRHWPDGDPIGEELVFGDDEPPVRIVGVVGDVSQFSLDRPPEPTVYIPHPQAPAWMRDDQNLVVRAGREPAALAAEVRTAILATEPRMPISDMRPMTDVLGDTLAQPRFRTLLLAAFALMAFVLAVVGIYGMVAHGVARRTRELGVRMALGASAGRIARTVVGQGLRPVLVGVGLGLAGALAAGRLLAGLLFGVGATDPVTFTAVPVALFAVGALAAWLPARRAGRRAVAAVMS